MIRTGLKSKFETGDIPTQQDFADLIDSFYHLVDDILLKPEFADFFITGLVTDVYLGNANKSVSDFLVKLLAKFKNVCNETLVNTTNFTKNLSNLDNTPQKIFDKIDDLNLANTLSVQNSSDTTFTNRDIMKFASDLFSVSDDGVSKTLIDLNKASQLIAEDETTVNNAMIMTAIRTWQAINRVKAIANSWAQLQTFTSGAKLSNLAGTKTRPLSVDMNGNIIEGIENYAYQASININTEFPLLADVKKGYWYNVINTVTDNAGGGRTNTGQSFVNLDEIYWNGVNWSIYDEKILLSQNKYWVGNNLNAPTERTVALSKNIIGTDNLGNLQQAALTAACYWLGVAGVPTERTLALAKNLLKSDVNGNIAQATLSQNYFWMGDVNNIPSEVASTNALSDSGTLVAGTLRIDDTNISILSEALMGVSSSGQLNGKLTFTAYNQYMIFSSTDNTDTVRFRYVIFI